MGVFVLGDSGYTQKRWAIPIGAKYWGGQDIESISTKSNSARPQSTEAEIFYGIELAAKGKRRKGLLAAAEAMFTEDLAGRTFDFERDAARSFSKIAAQRRFLRRPISHADAQIAAIAQVLGAKLAARNVTDFHDCGIDVVDPWIGS
jgi:predicted nucleic acid-binding protein